MKKRILACLLALVMLIGLLPVTALAVDAGGTTVPMLDVSKSKTATALDANGCPCGLLSVSNLFCSYRAQK